MRAARLAQTVELPRPSLEELYQQALESAHGFQDVQRYQSLQTGSEWLSVEGESRSANRGFRSLGELLSNRPNIRSISQSDSAEGPDSKLVINEIFEDTDVRQALQLIESQVKIPLIVDEQVSGRVTATLEGATLDDALEKILAPLGLCYCRRAGHYLIGTTDPKSHLFHVIAETFEYLPQHLSATELMGLIPERTKLYLRAVEKRNAIIVEAPHEMAIEILNRLDQSDKPVPQVLLEVLVVIVSPDQEFNYGFNWNQILTIQGANAVNVGLSGLAFSGSASPYGLSHAFSDFAVTSAFVQLLAQEGYLSIRAAPRVMAKDGEKAEISINQESYFSTQQGSSSGTGSTQLVFSQNIQKVEAGISMTMTPTIRGDYVTVHIDKAEVSENIKTIDQTNNPTNNPYPLINRRRVNTTVEVPNGKTFVIGGLSQKETFYRTSKIPYLGSMRYLGRLFQTIEKQEYNAEVVIFISPRIIREPVSLPGEAPGSPQFLEGSPQAPSEPILIPPPSPSATTKAPNTLKQVSGHSRL